LSGAKDKSCIVYTYSFNLYVLVGFGLNAVTVVGRPIKYKRLRFILY
jgi:hypothetical protein